MAFPHHEIPLFESAHLDGVMANLLPPPRISGTTGPLFRESSRREPMLATPNPVPKRLAVAVDVAATVHEAMHVLPWYDGRLDVCILISHAVACFLRRVGFEAEIVLGVLNVVGWHRCNGDWKPVKHLTLGEPTPKKIGLHVFVRVRHDGRSYILDASLAQAERPEWRGTPHAVLAEIAPEEVYGFDHLDRHLAAGAEPLVGFRIFLPDRPDSYSRFAWYERVRKHGRALKAVSTAPDARLSRWKPVAARLVETWKAHMGAASA